LTTTEQHRSAVLNQVLEGKLTAMEAGAVLQLSERQVRRILAAYREAGAAALAHGNRGCPPVHAISAEVRQRVVTLAQSAAYTGCNDQFLSELLAEREGLVLSRSTIRRILLAAGVRRPRTRRPTPHRRRRERYPQEGMLLQVDGSPHAWLEDRGPVLTLLAAIDDATNQVPAALFRAQEDAQGYFLLLQEIVRTKGLPLALYRDRHGIFVRSPRAPETLAEQLAGRREPTQFGRLLEELGIGSIGAHSPQAKGRIERLFGCLQERLVVELRLAGATTLAEANAVLPAFLAKHNARFAVAPAQPGLAYRPVPAGFCYEEVFCFKYRRTVAADNTVRLGEHRLQLLPSRQRPSYARAQVEVQERLDGSLAVYCQAACVATQPAPKEAPALRARAGRGRVRAPAPQPAEVAAAGPPASATDGSTTRPAEPVGRTGTAGRAVPKPDHPWRQGYQARVTQSQNA
jgi:hypothetical protein